MRKDNVRAGLVLALAIYAAMTLWTDAPPIGHLAGVALRWNFVVGLALGGWIIGK